jgi:hypothetical protein
VDAVFILVADLKVVMILVRRQAPQMAVPPWSRTLTMFGDDSRTSDQAEIVKVDLLDRKTSTTAYWGGVDSHVRSSSWNRMQEKMREMEAPGGRGGEEREGEFGGQVGGERGGSWGGPHTYTPTLTLADASSWLTGGCRHP